MWDGASLLWGVGASSFPVVAVLLPSPDPVVAVFDHLLLTAADPVVLQVADHPLPPAVDPVALVSDPLFRVLEALVSYPLYPLRGVVGVGQE